MELLLEGEAVELDLMLEELVLQCLVGGRRANAVKQVAVVLHHTTRTEGKVVVSDVKEEQGVDAYGVKLCDSAHLVEVVTAGEALQTLGVQLAASRVQLLAFVTLKLSAKRVDRDHKRTSVRLKLQHTHAHTHQF